MSHTKGEWKIFTDSEGYLSIFPIDAYIDHGSKNITDEDRANARLIAAAPDLLEACEAVSKLVGDFRPDKDTMIVLEAAIAKAKQE